MGRKEKIALMVAGGIIFFIVMCKGYGIWAIAGAAALGWYWKRKQRGEANEKEQRTFY